MLKRRSYKIFFTLTFLQETSAYAPDWNLSVNSHKVSNSWSYSSSTIFSRFFQQRRQFQRRQFLRSVGNNSNYFSVLWSTTREKIIGVVGNNAEQYTWTEIRAVFRAVAYNMEKLSAWNIFQSCGRG
jgi:hypothetical protein